MDLGKKDILGHHSSSPESKESALNADSSHGALPLEIIKLFFSMRRPDVRRIRVMFEGYYPFFYLEKVKKPNQNFTFNVVFKDYLLALLFACTWLSSMPLLHAIGMTLLTFSFWSIYEVGYFENDLIAERYEEKPVLSDEYQQYKDRMNVFLPWVVSLVIAVPGIAFIILGNGLTWETSVNWDLYPKLLTWHSFVLDFSLWATALACTRLLFFSYNYLDERTRIWLYPLLQFAKYSGILLITKVSAVGLALIISQIFVEWIPYVIYRCGGDRTLLKEQVFRIFLFLLLTVLVVNVQQDATILLTAQFITILSWYCARSLSQAKELFKSVHLIWN